MLKLFWKLKFTLWLQADLLREAVVKKLLTDQPREEIEKLEKDVTNNIIFIMTIVTVRLI